MRGLNSPLTYSRSSFIISFVFMMITAAVLAEICSALPLSGSIYIWAAESAGPKYARFFGFLVAWWSSTAWMTFAAGNCQVRSRDSMRPSTLLTFCTIHRPLPTISCPNCLSGRLISQVVLTTITSSGGPSSGPYLRVSWCCPSPSITFPRDCIPRCSSFPSGYISSISSSASSGSPSGSRKRTGSALRRRCSPPHVSVHKDFASHFSEVVKLNR